MNENEKLDVLLTKMTAMEGKMSSMEGKMSSMEGKMSTMDGRITTIEEQMVTKGYLDTRLHELQNDILEEVDTVQKKSNAHYQELKDEIRLVRDGFHVRDMEIIFTRLTNVEQEVENIKAKVS